MSVQFTAEQLAWRDLARDFFEREVRPVAAEIDARPDPQDCYPGELVEKLSKIGLRTLALPKQYGGINADAATKALLLMTMCEVEAGTAKIMSQCWKVSQVIVEAGTDLQQEKFLREFAADHRYTTSILMTEPNAGSDNILPYNAPGAGVALTAIPDGDCYVLNGTKCLNSLVSFSKLLLVYARTDPSRPVRQGTSTFLVPADLPGITYGEVHDKMGFRLYPNGETFFADVRVPAEYMIGGLNAGFDTFSQIFRGSLEIPATYLGICKAMYRIALDHAKGRIQGGKPIVEHQAVGTMLAEIAMAIDTLEGYLWDTAWHLQNDRQFDAKKTRFGKMFAADCFVKCMVLGLEVMGGAGIMRDNPMEKLIRDGLTFLHGDGTNSLTKLRVVPLLA